MSKFGEGTAFDTEVHDNIDKGRNQSPHDRRRRPIKAKYDRLLIALESTTRFRDREAEFRKQHGPVKIIIKNGQPVAK